MLDVSDLPVIYTAWRNRYHDRDNRMELIDRVITGDFGVFGLADVGRVYFEGESSDTWHTGVGGGLWFAFLDPANTLTVSLARGDNRTALYLRAGFGY